MQIESLYADGGVIGRNPSPIGGTWAFCAVAASETMVFWRSGVLTPDATMPRGITNNITELIAVVEALEWVGVVAPGWHGRLCSDSLVTITRVFRAGALNGVPNWLVGRLQAIQRTGALAHVTPVLLDGHPTRAQLAVGIGSRGHPVSVHNVLCDARCTAIGKAFVTAGQLRDGSTDGPYV